MSITKMTKEQFHQFAAEFKAIEGWESGDRYDEPCDHIAIVSINATDCQCMDCLRTWKKEPAFKSDWPSCDRG